MTSCPHCTAQVGPDDNFCEECGRALGYSPQPAQAGPENATRDHLEIVLSAGFAAISDRGLVHRRNEDMAALAEVAGPAGLVQIAAVCDGVSISSHPQEASEAGARAMVEAARSALLGGAGLLAAAEAGVAAAQAAVCACSGPDEETGAASTLIALLRRGPEAVLVWIGDSRAYLLNGVQGRQITLDDSWINEVVAAGEMSLAEASRHPSAHGITRCLGPLEEGEVFRPHIEAISLPPVGRVLLCSDGLWNYAGEPEDLLAILGKADGDALAACRALIDHAKGKGGRDNITAVLLELGC